MTPHEIIELMAGFDELKRSRFAGGAALATLVRTRGPVFRRAGACMLVHGDGRIVRGLSAGCPEADIVERAREVIASGEARLLNYDREHGYDVLLELGCGGEMQVLVEPLQGPENLRFVDAIAGCLQARSEATLMTLYATGDRCLPQPRRLLWSNGLLLDEIGSQATTEVLLSQLPASASNAARVQDVDTADGRLQLLVEHLQPRMRLLLIGINTTTLALARLAHGLGWVVQLVDHRDDTPAPALPPDTELLRGNVTRLQARLGFDLRTAVVVMTHNLERDLDWLRLLAQQPLAYLGAVGSRGRAEKMREAIGASRTPLNAPAGLDIGSETPEEIALAIAAEIQATLHRRSGERLSGRDGPIH